MTKLFNSDALAALGADLVLSIDEDGVIVTAHGDARMLCTYSTSELAMCNVYQLLKATDVGSIRAAASNLKPGDRASFDDPAFGDNGRRIILQRPAGNHGLLTMVMADLQNHQQLSHDPVEERHVRAFRSAITDRQIKVALQPIVNAETAIVSHYEVLARFPFESSPAPYIIAAERAGVIFELDCFMIDAAAARLARKDDGLKLSVNMSGDTIQNAEQIGLIQRLIDSYDFDKRRLIIELTESSEIHNIDLASRSVDSLRETGVRVVLDDFGAGAASFGYLRYLNVDGVKFDGCFLSARGANARNQALMRSIASMCAELGMTAVGERVETEQDRQILLDAGISYAQGWLFGRPEVDESFFEKQTSKIEAA